MFEMGAMGLAWLLLAAASLSIYWASPRQALSSAPPPRGLLPGAALAFVLASVLMAWVHGAVPGVLLALCALMMGVMAIPSVIVWRRGGPAGSAGTGTGGSPQRRAAREEEGG